ncbi:hypothetical protein [Nonomuraea sp. NPDC050540]|uniref:hypothetical protein n=1 Tax=Nonomuraea sp. NPDC050540 TaxID=3364367 RepID=UPI0037B426F5
MRRHNIRHPHAAAYFRIPNHLLGGIAYNEVGGDPVFFDDAGFIKEFMKGGMTRALKASFGPVQMQLRVAAYMLGYTKVTTDLAQQIITLLQNPAANLFIVAKYISDVHQSPRRWGDVEEKFIAAHYNGGPKGWVSDDAQRYARDYMKYRPWVKSVLGPGGAVAN